MPDQFSPEKRKAIMSSIRSKGSLAERTAFSYLRKHRVYFQRHYKRVPGTPDIALPRKRRAVFIDGDFWHGRSLEQLMAKRGGRDDYWVAKITRNVERDKNNRILLEELGWRVLAVWESDIIRKRTREKSLDEIRHFLTS